jgi:hypothetical protein
VPDDVDTAALSAHAVAAGFAFMYISGGAVRRSLISTMCARLPAVKREAEEGLAVSDDSRIHVVDGGLPATLNDGAGSQTDHRTLQEAVAAWLALTSAQKIRATVKVIGGPVYTAQQIRRLEFGPKPPDHVRAADAVE